MGGGGGGVWNLLLREPLWEELCVGIETVGSVGASGGGGVSKPGGWPGTCTGGKVILEEVGKTDETGAKGDTKAEVDGKDFCNP